MKNVSLLIDIKKFKEESMDFPMYVRNIIGVYNHDTLNKIWLGFLGISSISLEIRL